MRLSDGGRLVSRNTTSRFSRFWCRGWTRHVGLVRTGLLLAIAAVNLHQLIAWVRSTGDTRDEIALMDITDHGFVEYDAHGNLDTGGPEPGDDGR